MTTIDSLPSARGAPLPSTPEGWAAYGKATASVAARAIGFSRTMIHTLAQSGELPSTPVMGRILRIEGLVVWAAALGATPATLREVDMRVKDGRDVAEIAAFVREQVKNQPAPAKLKPRGRNAKKTASGDGDAE